MAFLKKDFRNDIGNELENILKRNYRCVLIASIFIDSNRSFDRNHFNCQQTTNLKNKMFRILKNIIIVG
jgi:hypothetical protein